MEPVRILIAEDDPIAVDEARAAIRSLGYVVAAVADTGEAAIRLASATHPDIALIDIRLPGDIDGVEAADWIRRQRGVPVIYLTASEHDESLERPRSARPYGYLQKRFTERELRLAVEAALARHRLERELRETRAQLDELLRNSEAGVRGGTTATCEDTDAELAAIYHNAPLIMLLIDSDLRVRKLNRTAVRFAGEPPSDDALRRLGEALRCVNALKDPEGCGYGEPCKRCILRLSILDTVQTGTPHEREEAQLVVRKKEREEVLHLAVSTAPVSVAGDRMVLVCLDDVTERKRTEETYHTLVENSIQGLIIFQEGRIVFANPQAARISGRTVRELSTMTEKELRAMVYPEDRRRLFADLAGLLAGVECSSPMTYRLVRPDGSVRWLNAFPACIPFRGRPAIQMACVDITERKAAKEALRRSEARYRDLVENANSIIMRMDPQGRITFFNEFAQKFFGFEAEEIVGRSALGTIVPETETTGRNLELALREICREPERYAAHEQENVRRDGRRVWVAWSHRALRDSNGDLAEILCVGNDITRQKELEAQLRQLQKMEAIGHLAGGIAHDFNNLLTTIQGNAEILRMESQEDSAVRQAADAIALSARRGAELTRQLLDFARKRPHAIEPVNVHALVAEVMQLLRRTTDRRIEIECWQHAGSAVVPGDSGQLHQVVLNLAMNAVDAMPHGGRLTVETHAVTLDEADCRLRPELRPGEYLILVVSDTGCGIPEDIQGRIFDPFFTTKNAGRGTGMGLAMAYGIVRDHGGAITVHSEPGHGTAFRVYLPLAVPEQAAPPPPPHPRPKATEAREIMVVDDDQTVLAVTARMLDRLGYRPKTFDDPHEAISYYRTHASHVALVILDLNMPGITGRECFDELRATNPNVRAILATGFGLDEDARRLIMEDMQDFVRKPYSLDDLASAIARALQRPSHP